MVDPGDAMNLRVGCQLEYDSEADAHAVALIEPHSSIQDTILGEQWDSELPPVRFRDIYGNVCRRLDLTPGASSFAYHATVRISPEPEAMPDERDVQHRVEELPSELLHWLLASRLCESDTLGDRSWELFGDTPRGAERVQAVCDWIHDNVEYGIPSVATTDRRRGLERRGGMCRDFAHLGVTFCRALGIPARYVFGYMPDIGIPGPYPADGLPRLVRGLAGRALVDLDARFNVPRIGRVPIGRGRDAVDVAMVTTYGDGYARAHDGLGRRDRRARVRPEWQHGL